MAYRDTVIRCLVAAGIAAGALAPAAAAEPLKICADPDNLPFSRSEGSERGVYIELAELVGKKLGQPVQFVWWYTHYQRRAIRGGLLQGNCDAMFALPADADYRMRGVVKSRPFLQVSYALVSAPGLSVTTIDQLKGRRLALQFASTPHVYLSTLSGFTSSTFRTTEEIFGALERGEADVGIVWGPSAGYENKTRFQGKWQVTPIAGHSFDHQVVVGVRAELDTLKQKIDEALTELQPDIRALAQRYGFPTQAPLELADRASSRAGRDRSSRPDVAGVTIPAAGWITVADDATTPKRPVRKAAAKKSEPEPAQVATAAPAAPALSEAAKSGLVRFNDRCSHCHGAGGASPVPERDLRRLKMRYDAKWEDVANTTIRKGRPDQGMPTWGGVIEEPEIEEIVAFLRTMQR